MNASNIKNLKKIVTHSGNFHTDEVFSCATLSLLCGDSVEIVRSREPEVFATGDFVVDVGGVYDAEIGRFDHHQKGGAGARENGIPYSSFGLVWKHFGEELAGSVHAAKIIDERIAQPVDAGDNGVETFVASGVVVPYFLHDIVSAFRPAWNEARTEDDGFFEVLEIAKKILSREIIHARSGEEGKLRAEEAYESAVDKRIITLDHHYPWYEALRAHDEPLFVVKPARGDDKMWKVEAVRSDVHSFKNRKDLPEVWAGKRDQELAEVSGVPDALFCHNKRFIAVAASKEGALMLAKLAVESEK